MVNNVRLGCLIIPAIACLLYTVQSGLGGEYSKEGKEVLIQPIVSEGKQEEEKDTQGLLVGNSVLYCSMRYGNFPNNETMPEGFHEQAGNALGSLWYCLEAVKTVPCDYNNVVSLTLYVTKKEYIQQIRDRISNFYQPPYPTNTIAVVDKLPRNSDVGAALMAYCGVVIRKPKDYSTEEQEY